MTEKIYLETFEKCLGSVYFPLLLGSENLEEQCTPLCCRSIQPLSKLHCFFWLMCAVQSVHIPFFAAVCPQQ